MSGEERRKQIIEKLGEQPVSAGKLAEAFGVSRQVIVQDVALLRAAGGSRASLRCAIPTSRCSKSCSSSSTRAAG